MISERDTIKYTHPCGYDKTVDEYSIGKGNCWQLRMTVNHVPRWFDSSLPSMVKEKKEEKKLPEGTHTSETDAKNRKVIRELKGRRPISE